jgi:hypothetical protein
MCLKIQYEKWPGSLRTAKKQLELQRIVAQKYKILERNWRSIRHDCKARKDAKSLQKPDSKKESAFSSNWRKSFDDLEDSIGPETCLKRHVVEQD